MVDIETACNGKKIRVTVFQRTDYLGIKTWEKRVFLDEKLIGFNWHYKTEKEAVLAALDSLEYLKEESKNWDINLVNYLTGLFSNH